jgi:DNA polymerase-3 subunit delta'
VAWLIDQGIERAEERLALASGAPLLARDASSLEEAAGALAEAMSAEPVNAFRAASRVGGFPVGLVIDLLQKWVYDLYCAHHALPIRYYKGRAALVMRAASRIRAEGVFELERRLTDARRLVDHPLNPRLVLEDLFCAYAEALSSRLPMS